MTGTMQKVKSPSCGVRCSKYLLFVFNVLFVLAGLLLIIVGAYTLSQTLKYESPYGVPVFILVIGGVIFIVAFFGCTGAIQQNVCMLKTFGILMIVILILSIAAVIAAFVLRSKAQSFVSDMLTGSIVTYTVDKADQEMWDFLQGQSACCGVTNYTDWRNNKELSPSNSVPASCCINRTDNNCGVGQLVKPTRIYLTGCLSSLTTSYEYLLLIVGCVIATVAVLMMVGIGLAFCLALSIRNDYQLM